jgi:hypothetical protein
VIAQAHFDTVRLPFPPAIVQRIGLALGSPFGAYSATSPPTSRTGSGRRSRRDRSSLMLRGERAQAAAATA